MSAVLRFSLILLAAGVLAFVARLMFVSSQAPEPVRQPDRQIRIATADLPKGLLLRESDLSWKAIRAEELPNGAILQGSPQAAKLPGAMLRNALTAGAPLLASNVIQPDSPGFLAAALAPGKRAVSVPINDVSGNAGLIQPGDHVDMILTQTMQRGAQQQKSMVSETVVDNVRVIAVGSTFTSSNDASVNDSGGRSQARTITVEVDPDVAQAVTVASHLGTLSLSLRSFAINDRTALPSGSGTVVAQSAPSDESRPTWGGDVSRALASMGQSPTPQAATPNSPPPKRNITLLRGQDKQELAF